MGSSRIKRKGSMAWGGVVCPLDWLGNYSGHTTETLDRGYTVIGYPVMDRGYLVKDRAT